MGNDSTGYIRRLDHVIVAVRDRTKWVPVIQRVLGLEPHRMREGENAGDSSGFSNAEFPIGDGFLGVVEPAGAQSQLHRFLSRFGDGFYGMSIDVGDVVEAAAAFKSEGVEYSGTPGRSLVWAPPRHTHGVLYQVIGNGGMLLGQGTNPRYRGLARLTIVVNNLDEAARDYERIFRLNDHDPVKGEPAGTRGIVFRLAGSDLGQTLVLVEPTEDGPVREQLNARGEGIYSFAISVSDLPGEIERLQREGIAFVSADGRVSIAPDALQGLRVDLVQS